MRSGVGWSQTRLTNHFACCPETVIYSRCTGVDSKVLSPSFFFFFLHHRLLRRDTFKVSLLIFNEIRVHISKGTAIHFPPERQQDREHRSEVFLHRGQQHLSYIGAQGDVATIPTTPSALLRLNSASLSFCSYLTLISG